ncbi:hypothetical protein PAPYR_3297 [Paratrimastix pyriformis]|uniref:Uncharacterized protein n=1 Tax=Paratrimastix pyriformis TaxID=342808 RepID=A0ABQ8UN93_9EUKA|nr:hypothetical protein PAPYR_3297 [Paratrimastix pyriformis]
MAGCRRGRLEEERKRVEVLVQLFQQYDDDTAGARAQIEAKLREENEKMLMHKLEEERAKLHKHMEEEMARMRSEATAQTGGAEDTSAKVEQLQTEAIIARHEKMYADKEIDAARRQIEFYRSALEQGTLIHEAELERLQLQHMQVFRKYREYFEEQRRKVEGRYLEVLQNCVNDCARLQMENMHARARLHGMGIHLPDLGMVVGAAPVSLPSPPPATPLRPGGPAGAAGLPMGIMSPPATASSPGLR